MTASSLRWGVLGARSRIYRNALAPVFDQLDGHQVVAEASRDGDDDSAYAALVSRADIDAVYIPLPNHLHLTWIERALQAGKHVLCEKPIALGLGDVERAFATAAACGRRLVEAYMWPHHRRSQETLRLVAQGAIGAPRFTHGLFTYRIEPGDHRRDHRGGGVLADVGIYCLGPALLIADRDPVAVAAAARRDVHGIDEATAGLVDWGDGFVSTFQVCFDAPGRTALEIVGTDGILRFPRYTHSGRDRTEQIVLHRDGAAEVIEVADDNGYRGMVEQFAAVVRGEAEPVFGPAHSLRLAGVLERLAEASSASPD